MVEALEVVGLSADFAAREWYQLSGGESRRVAWRPDSSSDEGPAPRRAHRQRGRENGSLIAGAVRNAWSRWGVVPLVASHDLPWLDEVTDRRVLMKRGRIQGADESPCTVTVETDFLL